MSLVVRKEDSDSLNEFGGYKEMQGVK